MDKKLRQAFKPYSFRARMLMMLTISTVVASVISIAFSYGYSRYSVRTELTADEHALASGMVELYERTQLAPMDVAAMSARDNLIVAPATPAQLELLSAEDFALLEAVGQCTVFAPGMSAVPISFVRLGDSVVTITPSKSVNVFLIAFLRIAFAAISFFSVFMLMSMLSTWRIAKPVSMLTKATREVAGGDFKVHLPEDRPDEVGQLMRAFNSMTGALDRTSYLQKDFISSISHEFRTPIASIKGFARLLQMPGLSEDQRQEYIGMIAQESDRLARLSSTLLRLSALEQQTTAATLTTFRLDEQARQAILRMEPVWSARGVDWALDLDEVEITTDSELLDQVWVNLLQNAVKFSAENTTIAVHVWEEAGLACFSVGDQGVGMDDETVSRIFDRFYQADRSRRGEGVGLGLSLVRRIIDLLCGAIDVQSTLGAGSTFTVRLPRKPAAKEDFRV